MEVFLYLFIHYAAPVLLLLYFLLHKFNSSIGLIVTTLLSISTVFFLYLWGQWAIVGSLYIKYVMIAVILFFIYLFVVKNRSITSSKGTMRLFLKIRVALTLLISVLVIFVCVKILTEVDSYELEAVDLEFPLKGSEFYVSSGGGSKLVNNHFKDYPNSQQYAIDINKLSGAKFISKKILSRNNEDHYVFSDTVYCPCKGVIEKIKEGVEDNRQSSMNVSNKDGTGNYISLKCDTTFVKMYHLKKGSILVSEGEKVRLGFPLALVGNSGFSQEPHLHIQASIYTEDSTSVGVPMRFNGKILSRNDTYKN